jgi:hypothetical protein
LENELGRDIPDAAAALLIALASWRASIIFQVQPFFRPRPISPEI